MSKKRFVILSTLILSFPIAYKLLTPTLMSSGANVKQINLKTAKKTESETKLASEAGAQVTEASAPPPPPSTPAVSQTEATKPTASVQSETQLTDAIIKSAETKATKETAKEAAPAPTKESKTTQAKSSETKAPAAKSKPAESAQAPKPSAVTLAPTELTKKAEAILAKAPTLNPKVLKLALTAYTNANKKGLQSKNNLLTIIDYSKPSDHKRLWVVDLKQNKVLYNTFAAHGKNTGDRYATSFSNKANSKSSSIGLFVTKETYHGKHGLSLRIHGLDKGFNDNALKRAVVFHGAAYVNDYIAKAKGRIGRSWGCPAVPYALSTPIINTIKNGTLVFAYAPGLMYEVKSKFMQG